jgi:hypothetical protein
VLRAGDGQLFSQIEAELAAGRKIWIRGYVSLTDSGPRLYGTGGPDLFRGRSLFVKASRRSLFEGDRGWVCGTRRRAWRQTIRHGQAQAPAMRHLTSA